MRHLSLVLTRREFIGLSALGAARALLPWAVAGESRRAVPAALLGAGRRGREWLRLLHGQPALTLVAVGDPDAGALRRAVRAAPFPPEPTVSRDDPTILADPGVGAVIIAAPPEAGHRLALDALRAGKHVYLDAPLTTSPDSLERLLERAGRESRLLWPVRAAHASDAAQQTVAAVRGGRIGDVTRARIEWTVRTRGAAGTLLPLPDTMAQEIDLALTGLRAGDPVEMHAMMGWTGDPLSKEPARQATLGCRFDGGATLELVVMAAPLPGSLYGKAVHPAGAIESSVCFEGQRGRLAVSGVAARRPLERFGTGAALADLLSFAAALRAPGPGHTEALRTAILAAVVLQNARAALSRLANRT